MKLDENEWNFQNTCRARPQMYTGSLNVTFYGARMKQHTTNQK